MPPEAVGSGAAPLDAPRGRLAARLVAVVVGTLLAASAMAGVAILVLERQQLLQDELAETRLLVRSLQVSIENALRDGQTPDITELLTRLDQVDAGLEVLVFPAGGQAQTSAGGQVDLPSVAATRRRLDQEVESLDLVEDHLGASRIVAGAALRGDQGEPLGQLVVARPLDALEGDLYATTWLTIGAALAFALATSAALAVVLRREISTPLARFAEATSRLGEDLDLPLRLPRATSVELRELQGGLLSLQARLRQERDARQAEVERREGVERQLREADKLVVVGQLAAGLAHEIGSPLQVLIGRARLLAELEEASPEVRRQGASIEDQACRIVRIVERLQNVTRRRLPQARVIDLREVVGQVVWLVQGEAKRRGVVLSFRADPAPVLVCTDPDEVQQVALNLTLNALQATAAGRRVDVEVVRAAAVGGFSVQDQGVGMEPAVLARATEPFFTTRTDRGGTGLGLAVVQSLLQRQRATWKLTSEPGQGTRAEVQWPVVEP